VTGTVKGGGPLAGATVTIVGAPVPPATTDATGAYSFAAVPHGPHTFNVTYGGCATPRSFSKNVNGPETFNLKVTRVTDAYGHRCDLQPSAWIAGATAVGLTGDDATAVVPLPFDFSFYGTSYSAANVSTNGFLSFTGASTIPMNTGIPVASEPNGAVYVEWDNLQVDASAGVFTKSLGSAPNRRFVIEWRNIKPFNAIERWDLEVVLYETGKLLLQYRNVDALRDMGSSATVGIENATGSDALQYLRNQAGLTDETAILFTRPGAPPF
jgi:hypothetical protein